MQLPEGNENAGNITGRCVPNLRLALQQHRLHQAAHPEPRLGQTSEQQGRLRDGEGARRRGRSRRRRPTCLLLRQLRLAPSSPPLLLSLPRIPWVLSRRSAQLRLSPALQGDGVHFDACAALGCHSLQHLPGRPAVVLRNVRMCSVGLKRGSNHMTLCWRCYAA